MTVAEQFGRSLCAWRVWAGFTQDAFGQAAGLHRTEISLIERGKREPRLSTILKLADALQIEASQLIAGIRRPEAFRGVSNE